MERSFEAVRRAAEQGAALFAGNGVGTIAVEGGERSSWLNGLVTCDVTKLAPGVAAYGLAVVKVGRIITDLFVVEAGERLLVGLPAAKVAPFREHLERFLVMEDATHEDASAELAWAFAHGPRAAEIFASVAPKHGAFAGSVDVTGLGGAAAAVPRAALEGFLRDAEAAGAVAGTDEDWDRLRIERRLARFGVDFDEQNYPQEANLADLAVSFQKGCYLGQEVVCRLQMRGNVSRRIVTLHLDGEVPQPGAELTSDGRAAGKVTSATVDPTGGSMALAMVRCVFTEPGTVLDLGGRPATVISK